MGGNYNWQETWRCFPCKIVQHFTKNDNTIMRPLRHTNLHNIKGGILQHIHHMISSLLSHSEPVHSNRPHISVPYCSILSTAVWHSIHSLKTSRAHIPQHTIQKYNTRYYATSRHIHYSRPQQNF